MALMTSIVEIGACSEALGKAESEGLKIFLIFMCVCLFRAAPAAHGGSQARGLIGATAAGLHHSHSNTRSEPHL